MRFAFFGDLVFPEHQQIEKNIKITKRFILSYCDFSEWTQF